MVIRYFPLIFFITTAAFNPAPILAISSSSNHLLLLEVESNWSVLQESDLLDKDFEDGRLGPWFDSSPGTIHWRVEDLASPFESDYPAPTRPDNNGTKHVRAERLQPFNADLAVLRSPEFQAYPGDEISFSFWIRSRHPRGNNLQVVMLVNNTEQILKDASIYSNSANFEWNNESALIPINEPTVIELLFYGYCGSNPEDAIAIDDIRIRSTLPPTTTPTPSECPVPNGIFPIPPPYCGPDYYKCTDGVATIITCPSGLFYDSSTLTCTEPAEATCVKEFKCPDGTTNGLLPLYPEACSSYYFACYQNGTFLQVCANGEYAFNPSGCQCESPELCAPAATNDTCVPATLLFAAPAVIG